MRKKEEKYKENTIVIRKRLVFSLLDLYKDLPPRTVN